MSTQVVRVQGYTKGSLANIGNECDRKPGVKHRNSDIDTSLSHLNHSYKDCDLSFYSEFHQLLAMNNCEYKEKKNGIAFEGMIITADLEFFEKLGYSAGGKPPKDVCSFFDRAYNWALQQIGYNGTDRNILSAKVHYDEKTPHLHIYYLPMTNRWQEKVYAKDDNGKVLRTSKGSPVQAKDRNGKTIYKQVVNDTPKLSRTEFWRNKGGKNSYHYLQNSFHREIGQAYGLERGEIGSTRKHQTKHQWKQKQLEAELRPLQNLQVQTQEIDNEETKLPLGMSLVNTQNYEQTKQQAKSYRVNQPEIRRNRRDRAKIDTERKELDIERQRLESLAANTEEAYSRQINLNRCLEDTERQLQERTVETEALRCRVQEIQGNLAESERKRQTAEQTLTDVLQAVSLLIHDDMTGYKVNGLTEQQKQLIDAVVNHGSAVMTRNGRKDLAKEIDTTIRISQGIKAEIKKLEPTPVRSHSRGR